MWTTLNTTHKLNFSSTVITWSATGSRFSFSATPMTCDSLSFKTSHLTSAMKRCYTWFTTRNSPLQNFKGNYHVQRSFSGIHVIKTSNPNLPSHFINTEFYIFLRTVWGSTFNTMTSIYAGRSSVQILAWTRELYLLQNIQTSSSTHPTSNSIKATKWPVQTVWPSTAT